MDHAQDMARWAKRRNRILKDRAKGMSTLKLAAKYGISRQRIDQILKAEALKSSKRPVVEKTQCVEY